MADNWVSYWNRKDAMTGSLWQAQSAFFVRQVLREIAFGPDDILLDLGCGNGHVTAGLAPYVKEAHGADTSVQAVHQARKLFAAVPNLHFHEVPPDRYLELDALPPRGVTRIVCVSVVQYYASLDEVRQLIARAKSIAAPGCRMLIADLLTEYTLHKDIAGVLLGGVHSGTFFAKLHEVLSGNHSLYARIRACNPVLTMSREDIRQLCAAEGVGLRFIGRNLTGNMFRSHALLDLFPGTHA